MQEEGQPQLCALKATLSSFSEGFTVFCFRPSINPTQEQPAITKYCQTVSNKPKARSPTTKKLNAFLNLFLGVGGFGSLAQQRWLGLWVERFCFWPRRFRVWGFRV